MDILKYQARLEKKKLSELKVRIFKEMPVLNRDDGTPSICVSCLNDIKDSESVGICPNGHGFHVKCLSSWIKSQDRCPVCDGRLLPFILRDYRETLASTSSNISRNESQGLGDSAELFDKLMAEKEDKNRLLNDLKMKDQIINELRSQLQK